MFDLSTTIIPGGLSSADFLTQWGGVFVALGMTVYDSYTSGGNTIRVFRLIQNASATGTVYLQYTVTTASINTYFSPSLSTYSAWNTGTHTGTSTGSPGAATTLYPVLPTSVYIFKSDNGEGNFAFFTNGGSTSVTGIAGWVRPATKHPNYDEASNAFYFLTISTSMLTIYTPRNALAATINISSNISSTGTISADNYVRPYAPGTKLVYVNSSVGGVYGRFSDDFADTGATNATFGQILQDASVPENRYFCLSASMAVRIR